MTESNTNSVVDVDDYRVTSNTEGADDMAKGLKEPKSDKEPKIVRGKAEKEKPETDEKADDDKGDDVSKAASTLGKKGAEAAAKARKEAEKEKADEKEEKPKPEVEAKAEPEAKEPEEKPKPKPRDDMQERIRQQSEQLRREREERAAERQRYEERLAAIEARVNGKPAAEPGKPEATADADPEPKEEDFDLHSEWVRQHSRWAARTEGRNAAREEYETRTRQAEVYQKATTYTQNVVDHMKRFEDRVAKATEEDPSLADVVDVREIARATTYMLPPNQMPGPINLIANDITASAHSAALASHLKRNPEEFSRIIETGKAAYRMGADEQEALLRAEQAIHREMAILEVRLESAKAKPAAPSVPEKAEPSRATPPMKPVNASTHTGGEPSDDAPYDDHVEYWNAKEAAARKR